MLSVWCGSVECVESYFSSTVRFHDVTLKHGHIVILSILLSKQTAGIWTSDRQVKGITVPLPVTKVYRRSRGKAPLILNLST